MYRRQAPFMTLSRFDMPRSGERLAAGVATTLGGIAFAGDRGITRVEVGVGTPDQSAASLLWMEADLLPVIDVAATPIRVERRLVGGAVEHHVVGIVWGGARPVTTLEIRFGPRDPWRPLDVCPPPTSTRAWALWTYRWTPPAPGSYSISLRCPDPDVRTRRLDLFFYTRRVSIERLTMGD